MRFEFTDVMKNIDKKIEPYINISGTDINISDSAPKWVFDEYEKMIEIINELVED